MICARYVSTILVGLLMMTSVGRADFWSKTWHEIKNAGRDINKAAIAVGKGAEKAADGASREFCDLMTLGQYSQGNASCGINAGVGRDAQGTYTYDPQNPDQKYRGSTSDKNDGPSDQRLTEMARSFQESQIRTWEYQDEDVYGIRRFLLPNTVIGEAWPNAERELRPPTKTGEVRACCKGGAGGFLATREDHGSIRFHAGTDYVNQAGDPIYAPMSGTVQRMKNPGRPGLNGLLITNEKGYSASVYYVQPSKEIETSLKRSESKGGRPFRVEAGKTVIGSAQDLHPAYPADVPQHVHVTLQDPQGNPVAPDGKVRIRKTPATATAEQK